jgi:hypothetical protein
VLISVLLATIPKLPLQAKSARSLFYPRQPNLPRLVGRRKPHGNPLHQLDGIVNRIAERILSRGRRTAIQSRQSPHQKHSRDKIDQFLSAFVHRKEDLSASKVRWIIRATKNNCADRARFGFAALTLRASTSGNRSKRLLANRRTIGTKHIAKFMSGSRPAASLNPWLKLERPSSSCRRCKSIT